MEATPEVKAIQPIQPSLSYDTTIYHNDEEPKRLKAGDHLPEGWTTEPGTLNVSWTNNRDGSWIRTVVKK